MGPHSTVGNCCGRHCDGSGGVVAFHDATRGSAVLGPCQTGVRLVSDRCQTGVRLVSDWDRTGVRPGSDRCRTGVRLVSDQPMAELVPGFPASDLLVYRPVGRLRALGGQPRLLRPRREPIEPQF
jgi:hypothetical protein